MGLGASTTTDFVVTKTFGAAPNRQFWISFNSCTEVNLKNGWTYFSVVLEETSNKIYIVDQRSNCVDGQTLCNAKAKFSIGIKISNTETYTVAGSPNVANESTNDATPVDNVSYMFAPGTQAQNDVNMVSLNLPKFSEKNTAISIKGKLLNFGSQSLSSYKLNYTVNGGAVTTMQVSGLNIAASGGSYDFTHNIPYTPTAAQTANIKVWTSNPNAGVDGDLNNDTLTGVITILDKIIPRRSIYEIFTSSTCPPCKPGNEVMTEILNQRVGKFAVIKYQYFGPGLGDPYFTTECYNRGVYYGQTAAGTAGYGVPDLYIDGGWGNNPNGLTVGDFDNFQTIPSLMEMSSKINVTNKKADIEITVKPITDLPAGNYRLRVAIVEKNTTANVKNNGETSFDFVMKKMLPNETGSAFTFPAKDQSKTVNLTYTFPGNYRLPSSARTSSSVVPTGAGYSGINLATEHSVEKFYDLQVVAFIQNDDTKEILQSSWSSQDWAIGQNEVAKELALSVYPNPNNGNFEVSLPENVKTGEITVRDINGRLIHTQAIGVNNTAIALEGVSNGIYFVELKAEGKTAVQKVNIIR
ncbi:MAG: T9SS type A sorting domain-containing protein [Bacteroidetes bacterium]|nr:T9SS type A sorting domain-containing protein [Bacteroidota bacterium]